MSLTVDPSEEEEEVVRLSAAEVKKYEARFSQSVVRFSNLQINECIGKGTTTYIILCTMLLKYAILHQCHVNFTNEVTLKS